LDQMRNDTELENKLIGDKVFDLAKDPKLGFQSPVVKSSVPYLDFSKVDNAMFQLKSTADGLKSALSKADKLASEKLTVLNGILFRAEQQLLFDKGLPRRPWYKHMIYAPGFYTGYGVKTLPGIREGIEERNWNEAQTYADNLANTLLQFNVTLQKAVQIFK